MAVRGLLSHVVAAACGGILVFLALFNGCFPQGSERAEQIQGDPSQTLQRVNQPNCSVFVTELSILRADLAEKELALVHLQHRLNAMVTTAPLTPSPTTECKCSLPPGDDLDTLFKRRFKPKARFEVPDWEAFDPAYVFSSNRPAPVRLRKPLLKRCLGRLREDLTGPRPLIIFLLRFHVFVKLASETTLAIPREELTMSKNRNAKTVLHDCPTPFIVVVCACVSSG